VKEGNFLLKRKLRDLKLFARAAETGSGRTDRAEEDDIKRRRKLGFTKGEGPDVSRELPGRLGRNAKRRGGGTLAIRVAALSAGAGKKMRADHRSEPSSRDLKAEKPTLRRGRKNKQHTTKKKKKTKKTTRRRQNPDAGGKPKERGRRLLAIHRGGFRGDRNTSQRVVSSVGSVLVYWSERMGRNIPRENEGSSR